ncbi:MAG: HEAT repeat domain-containing protein [Actinomycetota bacterium]|nr:HEAT repeat domain-containing protein [Actinomycetota bacterium]
MSGRSGAGDPDRPPIEWVGGTTGWPLYWARVWGARGLLYVWDDSVSPELVAALTDSAWRVREMAAKVVRRREVGEAAGTLPDLVDDPVERVRIAAVRAVAVVGEGEHLELLVGVTQDPATRVARAAGMALGQLEEHLDRRA